MRERKYRIWEEEIMVDWNKLCEWDADNEVPLCEFLQGFYDVVVMEFVGLCDVNGKEIYEGDIIEVYNWGRLTKNELIGIAVVEHNASIHGWSHSPEFDIDPWDKFRNVKVVGNIYENKELLNEI